MLPSPTVDELYDDQFATSIGHLMASRPRIALQHLRIAQHDRTVIPAAAEEVLCAEGLVEDDLMRICFKGHKSSLSPQKGV